MEKIQPVAFITYKGHLLHAANPKVAEHSEPEPLYSKEALEVVAKAVLEEISRIAMIEGNVDIAAILNELTKKEQT